MEKSELYYSKYCKHSSEILNSMNKSGLHDKYIYICIDNRIMKNNIFYITLSNGTEKEIPHIITRVPALLLKPNYELLYGHQILDYINPQSKTIQEEKTKINEPDNFSFGIDNSITGVISDNFSFLDMSPEELSAKGNGGNRQMYNYQSLGQNYDSIQTPMMEDKKQKLDYSIEQLQQKRNNELS